MMSRVRFLAISLVSVLLTAGCTLNVGGGSPGSAAEDIVSTKRYDNLLVEIDHPAGWAPSEQALSQLRLALGEVTQKKDIEVKLTASVPAERRAYSWEEVRALEQEHRDERSGGDTAVLYVIYLAGSSSQNPDALGAVYAGTSIVMFQGRIREASQGLFAPREENIERAVLVHEFGHAAGLVNLGAPMTKAREDKDHPGHSSDKNSVMYWAVENREGLLTLVSGGESIPYRFTEDDKADLRALWK